MRIRPEGNGQPQFKVEVQRSSRLKAKIPKYDGHTPPSLAGRVSVGAPNSREEKKMRRLGL